MKTALRAAGLATPDLSMKVAAFAGMDDINGLEGEDRKSHQLLEQQIAAQPVRKTVLRMEDVSIVIPKPGGLKFQKKQIVGQETIKPHFHGVKSFNGIRVNCHYYGVYPDDFGKAVTARVELVEKTVGDRTFPLLNFYREFSLSQVTMKILPDEAGQVLVGTGHSLHFWPQEY